MIKVAFGSVPKDGGTFTFYRNMRQALLQHGVEFHCVTIGKLQAKLWDTAYVDEGCHLLAEQTYNVKKQARIFSQWCVENQIDLVMGINSEAILSAIPHLPETIRCISRCANSFDHGYRITLSGYERLAAIIAQTPRQLKDLTTQYNAAPERITVIPNGIDPTPFSQAFLSPETHHTSQELQLGFLGRLEHNQKGVLFIPEILAHLNQLQVRYHLKIAGKGKHADELKERLRQDIASGKVEFVGALNPNQVPAFLSSISGFLFPSQFEGCPNALIEAMMAGCVPISWRLEGITDFIIDDGINGFLAPLGDDKAFATHIAKLASNSTSLQKMSNAAKNDCIERFNTEVASSKYAALFKRVMLEPPPEWEPLPWSQFKADPNFDNSFKKYIPRGLRENIKACIASTKSRLAGN